MAKIGYDSIVSVPIYDYVTYEKKFGVKAPLFDPKSPTKLWALRGPNGETEPPAGTEFDNYHYPAIVNNKLVRLTVPLYLAYQYNIPGSDWAHTPGGKNPHTYPVPIKEEYAKLIEEGKLVFKNSSGAWYLEAPDTDTGATPFEDDVLGKLNAVLENQAKILLAISTFIGTTPRKP